MENLTQEQALELVFSNDRANYDKGIHYPTWKSWKHRFYKGILSYELQTKILRDFGYEIAVERQWKSPNNNQNGE